MKKFISFLIIIATIGVYCVLNIDTISDFAVKLFDNNPKPVILPGNEYTKKKGYEFVSLSEDYVPYSYQDILNIMYSTVNNGWEDFTFYCPTEYADCLKDVQSICEDSNLLSHVNNFVHPFNTFTNLKSVRSESGEINLHITYLYTDEEIDYINEKVNKIIENTIDDRMDDYEKIKAIHDYIINNTKYDVEKTESSGYESESSKANGLLKNHLATCNGYADTMAIILSKMGFDNYKIATTAEEISYSATGHVWNAVFVDGAWKHLDLTWDDPVSSDGKDYLYHKYFLVTNEEMDEADKGEVVIEEHNFNKQIYLEFK